MARQTRSADPAPANLSLEQLRTALPKLQRRLDELASLKVEDLQPASYHNVLEDMRRRLDDTLVDVFGHDTLDYRRYATHSLDDTPMVLGGGGYSWHERQRYVRSGVDKAIGRLKSAISIFTERLEDTGGGSSGGGGRAIIAYQGLDLHPEIARAASKLYRDGHYANAIESAVKALNGLVRLRSGLDVDGMQLMERAFSPKSPVLRFNDLSDQTDQDEQKGFMMLFSGAVAGLRNPRAHKFINDDPERALEFIAFVSLLAKLLDKAEA